MPQIIKRPAWVTTNPHRPLRDKISNMKLNIVHSFKVTSYGMQSGLCSMRGVHRAFNRGGRYDFINTRFSSFNFKS